MLNCKYNNQSTPSLISYKKTVLVPGPILSALHPALFLITAESEEITNPSHYDLRQLCERREWVSLPFTLAHTHSLTQNPGPLFKLVIHRHLTSLPFFLPLLQKPSHSQSDSLGSFLLMFEERRRDPFFFVALTRRRHEVVSKRRGEMCFNLTPTRLSFCKDVFPTMRHNRGQCTERIQTPFRATEGYVTTTGITNLDGFSIINITSKVNPGAGLAVNNRMYRKH